MAKSNHSINKVKYDVVKKHSAVTKKIVRKSKVFTCIRATLSCGISGWACGETLMECIDNAIWADGQLCG